MKTKIMIILIIIVITIPGCSKKDVADYTFIDSQAELSFYANGYKDLYDNSILIVEATMSSSKQEQMNVGEKVDETITYGITKTPMKISNIIKSDGSVKVGSEIIVLENYFLNTNLKGGYQIECVSGYRPIADNNTYLLFLYVEQNEIYSDYYAISGVYQGKYNLNLLNKQDLSGLSEEDYEIGTVSLDSYKSLMEDVMLNYSSLQK